MPVYALTDELMFPDPRLGEKDGLLAIGGDLQPDRLLLAYRNGIFPWYAEGQPILWWSPDPRMVLFPEKFKRHKNLRRTVESGKFTVRFDFNFEKVVALCSKVPRRGQGGTWITPEMIAAYLTLYKMGYGHSVETYKDGKLVGGLYGLSLGHVFFGESMFHLETDASKVALWHLVDRLIAWGFDLIDVQQETAHLRSLGGESMDRTKFLTLLDKFIRKPTRKGSWSEVSR
ncbi:MAG: leucyl/phenylalanyl-tRNA--protein transferase [bacterium]